MDVLREGLDCTASRYGVVKQFNGQRRHTQQLFIDSHKTIDDVVEDVYTYDFEQRRSIETFTEIAEQTAEQTRGG